MRVLWLTLRVPYPANSGELLYSRGLTEALAAQGVEVRALAAAGSPPEEAALPPGGRLHWEAATSPWRPRWQGLVHPRWPSSAHRLATPELQQRLEVRLREGGWQALVVDQAALGWALPVWERVPERPPLVYVAHNVESRIRPEFAASQDWGPRGLVLRWEAWKYARLEKALLNAAQLVTAITPEDEQAFRAQGYGRALLVLSPGRASQEVVLGPPLGQRPRRVILSGSCEWVVKQHNVRRFLSAALPVLNPAGVLVSIVGKMPEAFAQELRRSFPEAEIHPNVPDPAPFLEQARVGVIPEEAGGGFKLKALEYVFRGLPMAALPGTLAGLPLGEEGALVAANVTELALRLVEVIDDVERLSAIAARALARCDGQFEWVDRGAALQRALAALSSASKSQPSMPVLA